MIRKSFFISKELYEWAVGYIGRKGIKGPRGNISFAELIRRLLKKEKERDERK